MGLSNYSDNYISVPQIENTCNNIGSKVARVRTNYVGHLSLKFSYFLGLLFQLENQQTYAFFRHEKDFLKVPMYELSFRRNDFFHTMKLKAKFPYQSPNKEKVYVVCSQVPIKIADKCMDGFRPCLYGECIPETYFCDSYPQCHDHSDEINCTDSCPTSNLHYQCGMGKCIALSKVCDLISDCEEGEDEEE